MKDVNKLVVALLKELDAHPSEAVGHATVDFLKSQTSDARVWPTDAELVAELPTVKVYGNIKQQRLRAVFGAIEQHQRTERHEAVSLPTKLELEHVMPQGWRSFWDNGVGKEGDPALKRDHLVNTIGNLTLVTQKLNGALSNRPWTNSEAEVAAPTGVDAGLGKRALLNRYSVLLLNKDIVDNHADAWTDQDIGNRNIALAKVIGEVWARPG
jgi:hypothetical protein